jgi:hypothetical protein
MCDMYRGEEAKIDLASRADSASIKLYAGKGDDCSPVSAEQDHQQQRYVPRFDYYQPIKGAVFAAQLI